MTKLKSFPYFGGKITHLDFILEHLPYTERYIEPFGGSAAVLLNREPSPIETYNDLDGDVVNFFQVLREQPDELIRQLELTPYSRTEYYESREPATSNEIDDLERARRFFTRLSQGYNSLSSGEGDWSYVIGTSRRGMSNVVSWKKGFEEQLQTVAGRLSRVQIENQDAAHLIETHDHPDALFYCDPPYAPDSRKSGNYACEMSEQDHRELARVLNQCEAKVAISNYESDLMRELYSEWNVITGEEKTLASSSHNTSNSEILITNYDPQTAGKIQELSDTGTIQNRLEAFTDGGESE